MATLRPSRPSIAALLLAAGVLAVTAVLAACSTRATTPPAGPGTPSPAATPSGPGTTGGGPVATGGGSGEPTAPAASGARPDLSRLAITLEPFATVPGGPLAMSAPDDGTGRLFVASQDGRIWAVRADGSVPDEPMIDLRSRITSGGEQGLLGIAAHPAFPDDPRVFVDYTDTNGDTVVASLAVASNPDRLDPGSHRQLLFVDQPYANHNGGALAFGADGDLYVSLGDGGRGGDPHGNGQRLDTLLGKILRLDVDAGNGGGYGIPADNPFAAGGGAPEIWAYGLRNPWRLSFDRETHDLWIGDVGQGAWEEIDVAPAGTGGLDFGWNIMEGSHCYNADKCHQEGLTLPVSDYGRDLGCTVIGGYVYRGAAYPFLAGAYLFADYCSGNLFAIDSAVRQLTPPTVVGSASNGIAAWGQDAAGELYVLDLDGTISRVIATAR